MQTATVLYLSDAGSLPEDLEPEAALGRLGLDPAWTELSSAAPGFYSPQEAQLRLAERGAARIEGASASYVNGEWRVGAVRVRLWG